MAAQSAHIRASENNSDKLVDYLSVNLFCALAIEAHLNHVGPQVMKHWSPLKKKLSPKEKLEVLLAERGQSVDFSRSPYQSFIKVFQFRNAVAHAETEVLQFEMNDTPHESPQTDWQKLCEKSASERILEDTVKIIASLPTALGLGDQTPAFLLSETV
jgi:hypothetical protein